MEQLETTRAFVKVAQLGSFTRAAMALKLPKSTVSRLVSRLEEEAKTKLLTRTTRSLSLTAAGRAFYESCLGPLQQLEDARKSLQGQDSILTGTLRITAPEDLGTYFLSPALSQLSAQHPNLNFELKYTDEVVDLVREGFDLAFRLGKLPSSQLRARSLGEVWLALVASPSYLGKAEKIREPRDLLSHACVTFPTRGAQPRWVLKAGKRTETVAVRPRIQGNQMTSLVRLAVGGAGVALVPLYLCREFIEQKKLQRVLPDWEGPRYPVAMVAPLSTGLSARLKVVGDVLSDTVRQALTALK